MQFINFVTILILIVTTVKCCFFSFQRKPSTPSAPLPPSAEKYSARFTRSRFYIEIEEDSNHVTVVNAIKKMPSIHSQTLENNNITEPQELLPIEFNALVQEPEMPLIQSQLEGGDEESLDPRDLDIRKDWKGTCDSKHWDVCSRIEEIRVMNVHNKTKDGKTTMVPLELNCIDLNITCLSNGWTVNRCQMICMSKCNKEMLQNYDDFVDHVGPCKYT